MADSNPPEPGRVTATLLAGSWRPAPSALLPSLTDLSKIARLLLHNGSAGLAWWRIRDSELRDSQAGREFQEAFRWNTLRVALLERQTTEVFKSLRNAGVEPLLAKGWAASRLYPAQGLRPYGDIDLCVRAAEYRTALQVMERLAELACPVEWHCREFRELKDRPLDQLYERSQLVDLCDGQVRVLGVEDHFRLMCVHALRHGIWRPLWLCDIALVLESLPEDFDWDYCLAGSATRSAWVSCAITLAQELLEARLDRVPEKVCAKRLPHWMLPAVIRQWGREHYMTGPSLGSFIRRPLMLPAALWARWPNPIQATINMEGSLNEFPRFPYQVGECVRRLANFIREIWGQKATGLG